MRLTFVCVGRLSKEYQAVWRHYEDLMRPYADIDVLEVSEAPLSSGERNAREREGAAIQSLWRKGAYTIALDGQGRQHSSEELSSFLAEKKLYGRSHFQLLLGGASGLDPEVLLAADHRWSLSRSTFPHQMARCIVLEQLYRAIRIERGEPYHH